MPKFIVSALRGGKPLKTDVIETGDMEAALATAKLLWKNDLPFSVSWAALSGEDYPNMVARIEAEKKAREENRIGLWIVTGRWHVGTRNEMVLGRREVPAFDEHSAIEHARATFMDWKSPSVELSAKPYPYGWDKPGVKPEVHYAHIKLASARAQVWDIVGRMVRDEPVGDQELDVALNNVERAAVAVADANK